MASMFLGNFFKKFYYMAFQPYLWPANYYSYGFRITRRIYVATPIHQRLRISIAPGFIPVLGK
jgi:hypothetical protein